MSISSVLFFASCFAMYKLGGFTERYPGEVARRLRETVQWLWKWMNK